MIFTGYFALIWVTLLRKACDSLSDPQSHSSPILKKPNMNEFLSLGAQSAFEAEIRPSIQCQAKPDYIKEDWSFSTIRQSDGPLSEATRPWKPRYVKKIRESKASSTATLPKGVDHVGAGMTPSKYVGKP